MEGWLGFERHWLQELLAATLPAGAHPGVVETDLASFWPRFRRSAPRLLRFGLRAAVWALTLSPLLWPRYGWTTFTRLSAPARDAHLRHLADSRWYLVRQLVTTVELVACLAYFHDDSIRARFEEVGR